MIPKCPQIDQQNQSDLVVGEVLHAHQQEGEEQATEEEVHIEQVTLDVSTPEL